MEQFEKWNHIHYINDLRISDKITVKHRKQERNKGWKAALEWVLSIDSGFCNCGCPNDSWQEEGVLAKIEKELEE